MSDEGEEVVELRRIVESEIESRKASDERHERVAAEQAAQSMELMRMMTELLGKKNEEQGERTHEAPAVDDEERGSPVSSEPQDLRSHTGEGAVPVEVGSTWREWTR